MNPSLSQIYGSLDSNKPGQHYLIQVFSNPAASGHCYPANFLQVPVPVAPGCSTDAPYLMSAGQAFIGEGRVQADVNGHVDFHIVAKGQSVGNLVTATATEITPDGDGGFTPGNTSQFSEAVNLITRGH